MSPPLRGRSHEASCGREEMRRLRAGFVTPLPGGPGNRPGGIMTPPRAARWTGTGRKASSQEARTRRLCLWREPEARSRDGAPRGARVPGDRDAARRKDWCATRCSIPSPFARGERRDDGAPGAAQITRARKRALMNTGAGARPSAVSFMTTSMAFGSIARGGMGRDRRTQGDHMKSFFAGCLIAAALVAAQQAAAAELKVITGGSMGGPFAVLVPQFEQASGHKVTVFYGATAAAHQAHGRGRAVRRRHRAAARCYKDPGRGTQVRVRAGAAHRPRRLRRRGARRQREARPRHDRGVQAGDAQGKVRRLHPGQRGRRLYLKVFDRLGIGEAMKAKTKAVAKGGRVAQALVKGDAELGVFVVIVFAVPGVEIAGPFPAELQDELVWDGTLAVRTQAEPRPARPSSNSCASRSRRPCSRPRA